MSLPVGVRRGFYLSELLSVVRLMNLGRRGRDCILFEEERRAPRVGQAGDRTLVQEKPLHI